MMGSAGESGALTGEIPGGCGVRSHRPVPAVPSTSRAATPGPRIVARDLRAPDRDEGRGQGGDDGEGISRQSRFRSSRRTLVERALDPAAQGGSSRGAPDDASMTRKN